VNSLPELRHWQKVAMKRWFENNNRGCIEVATGGGKTTFAIAAYAELLKAKPDLKIVVVVPTTALADQWFVNFQEDLGINEAEIKNLTTTNLNPDKKVNIAIINTARSFNEKCQDSENTFLVLDECHRAGSSENSKALFSNAYATLGLSATPFREFDDGFKSFIEPKIGPVIFSYSLDDAIRDGVLTSMKITNIRIPLLDSEQSEYNELSNNAFYRIPTILSVLEGFRGERCLVFVESISAAEEAKKLLDEQQHSVTIYHSQLSDSIRRSNLRLFRKGVFEVLIACRALDEGFNVPEARIALIGAGTSSKRQRIQRMGRVLRSMTGKENAEVITIYATDVEEARLAQESQNLDDIVQISWKSVVHDR